MVAMPKSVSTTRPSVAQQHVARLDVAVDDPARVRGLERAEHGEPDLRGALRAAAGRRSRTTSARVRASTSSMTSYGGPSSSTTS